MASLQLSGLSTGIDTQSIIKQLMEIESQRLTKYQQKLTKFEEKKSTISQLNTHMTSFKSALSSIYSKTSLKSFNVTSSDSDVLTATATSSAYEGSHSIQVKQLATANRWVHEGFKYSTSFVGEGTMVLAYDNQEMIVQATSKTTLQDLVNQINNSSDNPGITASILKYNDGSGKEYHLVLSGDKSGSDYQISVQSSNSEVHNAATTLLSSGSNAQLTTKISELDDFSGQSMDFFDVDEIVISGTDHMGNTVNTTVQTTLLMTLEDVIEQAEDAFGDSVRITLDEGQLKVTDKSSGASLMTLSLSFNTATQSATLNFSQTTEGGSIVSNLASMEASKFTETQKAQDSLIKIDGYPSNVTDPGTGEILVENWLSRSTNTISDAIPGVTITLQSTTANTDGTYDSVNIGLTRDTESLKTKITTMVDAYNKLETYFKEVADYNIETKTSGVLSNDYSLTSIRSQFRSAILANATGFTGSDSFINFRDIGLTYDDEGMLEFDEDVFNESVSEDYAGVLSLLGAVKTGTTSGGDSAFIKFDDSSKSTTAGNYNIRVVLDAGGNITSALIKLASEDWSQARQAEVDGNYIMGSSSLDSKFKPLYPEYDLQLSVNTTRTNCTLETTVNVRQGVAGSLYDLVDSATKSSTGRIATAQSSLEDQISNMESRIESEQTRLERVQERLIAKYARLEKLLTTIQQQFSGISALSS